MYDIYKNLSKIIAPLLKVYFYLRCVLGKDEKSSVMNHFGKATIERPAGKMIWVHAASIGEASSAITYIKHYRSKHPDTQVLLTTITLTSANLLRNKIAAIPGCYHQFVVADVPNWIDNFLKYWNFDMAIFLESEIWPNIIHALNDRKIPIYLLNARLSDRSFRKWRLVKRMMTALLSRFKGILAQSKLDAERFSFFYKDNVLQIDNLKYANEPLLCDENLFEVFKSFCAGRNIFVAASTHSGEEEIILRAHKMMNSVVPVTTIIIPRHVERIHEICNICDKLNLRYTLRSDATRGCLANSDIFVVDTYGELGTFYRLSQVTFVGGSLVPIGGHNIFEPVLLERPVLHGPYMDNFKQITEILHQCGVAHEIKNENDIFDLCVEYFQNPSKRQNIVDLVKKCARNKALEQIDHVIK